MARIKELEDNSNEGLKQMAKEFDIKWAVRDKELQSQLDSAYGWQYLILYTKIVRYNKLTKW